jgi:hypothetical protein
VTNRALLLTGGLATGKTTVAKEVVAVASVIGLNVAAIDLDWLCWTTPSTVGVDALIAQNLAAVAGNFAAAGIDHLVLARGIVSPGGLKAVAAAIPGWELSVVRLLALRPTAERRIRARDSGAELQAHLAELDDISHRVAEAIPHARVVVNDQRDVGDLAREVMRLAHWIDDQHVSEPGRPEPVT